MLLNSSIKNYLPESSQVELTGGFFATLTFNNITENNEKAFLESLKNMGVNLSPAWSTIPSNFLEETKERGFFTRLTFPAYNPDEIEYGIMKIKTAVEKF